MESFISQLLEEEQKKIAHAIKKLPISEATMSDIPHEVDDVVHALAQERIRMEDLYRTWETAGFNDLSPLDKIITGLRELTELVYEQGCLLADQQLNVSNSENFLKPEEKPIVATISKEEILPENTEVLEEEKNISLEECENLCSSPANVNLRRAFKRCVCNYRKNKASEMSGEIDKIILTPKKNLKIFFVGETTPVFAYKDGAYSM